MYVMDQKYFILKSELLSVCLGKNLSNVVLNEMWFEVKILDFIHLNVKQR